MAAGARRLALLAALACAVARAARVVELTPDNFDVLVGNGADWMVELYAPWCGHCKRLEPEYERAAQQLFGRVSFGRVDGSRYRSLAMRFGVQGYPTLFHVHGETGDVRRAVVQHTAESLVGFATAGWRAPAWAPIPPWQSPNGVVKRAVFAGTRLAEKGARAVRGGSVG